MKQERVTARVTDKKYTQMTRIKILPKCPISNLSEIIKHFLNEASVAEK